MKNNDLSNSPFPRILVHREVVTLREQKTYRVMGILPRVVEEQYLNMTVLNNLHRISFKRNVNFEAFDFVDQDSMDEWFEYLNNNVANPFVTATGYGEFKDLNNDLLFRREVIGIVDIPARMLSYGSYGLDLGRFS